MKKNDGGPGLLRGLLVGLGGGQGPSRKRWGVIPVP